MCSCVSRAEDDALRSQLQEAQERLAAPIAAAEAPVAELEEETLPPPPSLASLALHDQEAPTCPITCAPMVDPVILSDGWSYEREAVEQWVKVQRAQGKVAVSAMSRKVSAMFFARRKPLSAHSPYAPPRGSASRPTATGRRFPTPTTRSRRSRA